MNMKRIGIIIAAILAVLIIYRIGEKISGAGKTQLDKPIPVVLQMPKIGVIEDKIELTGDIKANTEVNVRPRVAGRVAEIYVEEGDYVSEGDGMMSYVEGIQPDNELFDDMVTCAPISGVVGMKLVKVGEQVTSSLGLVNTAFVIYDISSVKIYGNIPEKYYSKVRKGTPVEITLDAYPGEKFSGYVNNIRPVVDPMTRTTQVEIKLLNRGNKIKPGMFANLKLVLSKRGGVMLVPGDAVLGENEKYVFVKEGDIAVRRNVVVGIQDDEAAEITYGLSPSEEVITVGQRVVKDGSKVQESKQ